MSLCAMTSIAVLSTYAALSMWLAPLIGRTRPDIAGLLRPPLFDFGQTYPSGSAAGFTVGMSKPVAGTTARRLKFAIEPSCWGDFRAGGESLYSDSQIGARM